ncbi:nucleolar MIF4G domain-containing protein 1 [Eucyclogobius newberryi]|uniref:nucleolar MIF4G domain-containing protein 1 n=1 Tax=Eucyclogobius newberryi TaxID=166745 RepID=UPI003B5C43C5
MKGNMKGKWKQTSKKKKANEVLQKYTVALEEFVKSKSTSEIVEHDDVKYVKRKSRKELRKEKRKLKKAKMKSHYEGKKDVSPPPIVSENTVIEKTSPKKKKSVKVNKELPDSSKVSVCKQESSKSSSVKKAKKTTKLQETRKQALLEANEQEDREIKKLERSLGLNKRKNRKSLPQSFVADGLDYILGVLDSGSSGAAMYESEDDLDMAKDKLSKLEEMEFQGSDEEEQRISSDEEEGPESSNDENDESDGVVESLDEDMGDEESESDQDESDGEEKDEPMTANAEGEEETTDAQTTEENTETSSTKYIPPQLRNVGDDKRKIDLEKLKRNVKGLINRLSEPNITSISSQLEEMYMSCSRKDMNDTLTEVLLAACVTSSLMPDRLLMEHVLLISILHHSVGLEVGAHFLETVVRRFYDVYKSHSEGKECDNLIAIIAHLYNFQVVHSLLIVDLLKLLVDAFTEKDIELVLFVLRNVGFALRKDDALALKDLISEAQRKATNVGAEFKDQTRVRFMLETMLALKNNDMRKIPGYDPEPVEKLRKLQRTLINRSASGSDVKLRVSLDCLLRAEQVGRWWIVGSSWSGAPMISNDRNTTAKETSTVGQFSAKVLDMARKQRMNTEVRRNIFCVLMTSEDYLDAFEKLLRMGLKDKQEREIVHVLIDCCLQEKTFNAFYAVLGEKFCTHDRRFQMTFQFSLWDKFRELDNLSNNTFNNLVKLITCFLQRKSLPLSILKIIEFGELDKPKVRFLRQMLTKLLKETDPEVLTCIFGKISGIPKLGMLREGLKLFISHFVLKNAPSLGPAEQAALLSERAQVATSAMEAKEAKLKL